MNRASSLKRGTLTFGVDVVEVGYTLTESGRGIMILEDDKNFLRLIEASSASLEAEDGTTHQVLVEIASIGPRGRSVRFTLAQGRVH